MRLVAMTGLFLYSSFRQILHYFFQFTYLFKKIPDAILRQELRKLYQTAFPDDEQIPWADLMRLVEEMLGPGTFTMCLGLFPSLYCVLR